MKKTMIVALFITALFSCSENEPEPKQEYGCHMAIPNGKTEYVLVRCATTQQYLAGNNEAEGGLSKSKWSSYFNHKFEQYCDDCK